MAADAPRGLCPKCLLKNALQTDGEITELAEPPPNTSIPTAGTAPSIGAVRYFGDYELSREIARGGMGVVYQARQVSLNRLVALKMILAANLASEPEVRRFQLEAEAAANLDHPNIVPIYEVGQHNGSHYFSMKLVEGGSLAASIQDLHAKGPAAAARLMAKVARAVHYAHQRGILHRDLKPGNILLDAQGEPHITDFGLAKRMSSQADLTQSGAVMGTPNYMAPEQAQGKVREMTVTADVFGLGAILYHLLVGNPPFRAETSLETLRKVIDEDPANPRLLNPKIDNDIETICLKALEKDSQRRYSTAQAFAEDLEKWSRGEPILARPITAAERLRKWARRKPAVAALSGAVVLASLAGISGVVFQWRQAEAARQVAVEKALLESEARLSAQRAQLAEATERANAEYESYVAKIGLAAAKIESGAFAFAAEMLDGCTPSLRHWEWDWLRPLCHPELKTFAGHTDRITAVALSPDGKLAATGSADTTVRVWELSSGKQVALFEKHKEEIQTLCFSADSAHLTSCGANSVHVWNVASNKHLREITGTWPQISGNGERVARTKDDSTVIQATESGRDLGSLPGMIFPLAFSTDGKRVVADETIPAALSDEESRLPFAEQKALMMKRMRKAMKIWDADTGKVVAELKHEGGNLMSATFSPDGSHLFTSRLYRGAERSELGLSCQLWNAKTGKEITSIPLGMVTLPVFSPDSRRLLARDWRHGQTAWIWELETAKEPLVITNASGLIPVAFTSDGRQFLAICQDRTVGLWNAETGGRGRTFKGHQQAVNVAAISRDGRRVLTGSGDKTAKLWDTSPDDRRRVLAAGTNSSATGLAGFSPDGRFALNSLGDHSVWIWEVATGKPIRTIQHSGFVMAASFSADGRTLSTISQLGGSDGLGRRLLQVSDIPTGEKLMGVTNLHLWKLSPDGRYAAGPGRPNYLEEGSEVVDMEGYARTNKAIRSTLVVYDTLARKAMTLKGHNDEITSIEFSRDGSLLLTGSADSTARVWDLGSGRELFSLVHPASTSVTQAAFTPDNRCVATSTTLMEQKPNFPNATPVPGEQSTLRVWELATKRTVVETKRDSTFLVQCTPDSRQMLLGAGDNTLATFDARSGQRLGTFKGHSAPIVGALFFKDGKRLLTGSSDQTAKLWDTATGRELLSLSHSAPVVGTALSPDNKRVLTVTADGNLTIWSTGTGNEKEGAL